MVKNKILIVYDVPNWAYHFRALALQKFAPEDFEVTITPVFKKLIQENTYDLVFYLPFSYIGRLRDYCTVLGKHPIYVTSYNVGWGYANAWLANAMKPSHLIVINNYEMWDKAGRLPGTCYIPNGVDRTIFKSTNPPEKRKPKLLWCGSTFHKRVKGFDDILLPLQSRLEKEFKIEMDLKLTDSSGKTKLTQQQMADWYNTGTVYVCASFVEGTPNPALEAASCGCSIISTPVGNMPELVKEGQNGYIISTRILQHFVDAVGLAISNQETLCKNMLNTIEGWDWSSRSKEFYELFRKLIIQFKEKPELYNESILKENPPTLSKDTLPDQVLQLRKLNQEAKDKGSKIQTILPPTPSVQAIEKLEKNFEVLPIPNSSPQLSIHQNPITEQSHIVKSVLTNSISTQMIQKRSAERNEILRRRKLFKSASLPNRVHRCYPPVTNNLPIIEKEKPYKSITIYSSSYGNYDNIKQQPKIQNVKYVFFTDNSHVTCPGWDVVVENNILSHYSPVLKAKYFKLHPHILFPESDYTIWIDASIIIKNSDFVQIMLSYLTENGFAAYKHPKRFSIFEEHLRLVNDRNFQYKDIINNQINVYKKENFPINFGLWAGGILVRQNKNKNAEIINNLWWEEILKWSSRDQLSLPYVLWKNNLKIDTINLNQISNQLFRINIHKFVNLY